MNSFVYKVQRILFQQVQGMLSAFLFSMLFILDYILVGFIHNQNASWGSLSLDTQIQLAWTTSSGSPKSSPSFWRFWLCVCMCLCVFGRERKKQRDWEKDWKRLRQRKREETENIVFLVSSASKVSVSASLMDHFTIPLVRFGSILLKMGARTLFLDFPLTYCSQAFADIANLQVRGDEEVYLTGLLCPFPFGFSAFPAFLSTHCPPAPPSLTCQVYFAMSEDSIICSAKQWAVYSRPII